MIDWGDVHFGDPAVDLSIGLSFLPPEGRAEFARSYGGIDEATWNRARLRAIHYGATLILYGTKVGDGSIEQAGRLALANSIE